MANDSRVILSPSLLAADFAAFGDGARLAVDAGAGWLHVDVMDGHFVPNLTFGSQIIAALKGKLPGIVFDVHLMVSRPDDWISPFADAGAGCITVHVEAATHLQRTLHAIRDAGCKAGAAINPATSPETLRYVTGDLDLALVMTVNPGFGGQKFLPVAARKVGELRQLREETGAAFQISVDGGVDAKTAPQLVADGADVLVAGSAVFGHPGGVAAGLAALRDAARAGSN